MTPDSATTPRGAFAVSFLNRLASRRASRRWRAVKCARRARARPARVPPRAALAFDVRALLDVDVCGAPPAPADPDGLSSRV